MNNRLACLILLAAPPHQAGKAALPLKTLWCGPAGPQGTHTETEKGKASWRMLRGEGVIADSERPPHSVSTHSRAAPPESLLRQEVAKVTACLLLSKGDLPRLPAQRGLWAGRSRL